MIKAMNQSVSRGSSFQLGTPLFYPGWRAADCTSTALVAATSIKCAHMTALRVNSFESVGLAEPTRTEAVGQMKATAHNTAAVDPAAVKANALTHSNIIIVI